MNIGAATPFTNTNLAATKPLKSLTFGQGPGAIDPYSWTGIDSTDTFASPNNLSMTHSEHVGGLLAKANIFANDTFVGGNVTSQSGNIGLIGSEVEGSIQTTGDVNIAHSEAIANGVYAGGNITAHEATINGPVQSKAGNVVLSYTNVDGDISAPKGDVQIIHADDIGNIESGRDVRVEDVTNIKKITTQGGNVRVRGTSKINTILIQNKASGTNPIVTIDKGVDVGNIQFENGKGTVILNKDATVGKTNGSIIEVSGDPEKHKLAKEKRDVVHCDPNGKGSAPGCNSEISLNGYNPFQYNQTDFDKAPLCNSGPSSGPSKKGLLAAGVLMLGLLIEGLRP